ncbi:MAG: shikimate kinase [Muribaculum sp.]|nr:shikimate kinase [Muribaculum sp.]
MTIFITGYMASGKTTFGRALARRLGMEFIDLDFYIEQRFRKKIPEIFAEKGESEFRRMESRMLREAGEFNDVVISCGGGTPCHQSNMEYMNSRGLTVWLKADLECTLRRMRQASGKRPLLKDKNDDELREFVVAHMAQRILFYSQASVAINSEQLETRAEIAHTVEEFVAEHLLVNKELGKRN